MLFFKSILQFPVAIQKLFSAVEKEESTIPLIKILLSVSSNGKLTLLLLLLYCLGNELTVLFRIC